MTSEKNVEIVKRTYASFSATLEVPSVGVANQAELDGTGAMPDVGVVSGRDAGMAAVRAYTDMFESYSVTLERVLHASEEHVVTEVIDGGRIKGSDRDVHNHFFHCFAFRDGEIVRWSAHTSPEEALEAAGLSE